MQAADSDEFRDHLATVGEDGKRKWLYPKRPKGNFYTARTIVSYVLLAFFILAPFIYLGGEQLLLFNLPERKFVLFGSIFYAHDFKYFMFAMITGVVSIAIFTLIFGRLFCGWICPQTIFMEMLFRKIEYFIEGDAGAQKALNAAPMSGKKFAKKAAKHAIFFALSFGVSNLFLAYIIGSEALLGIITDPPKAHWVGLLMITLFSFVFYGVFMFLREQVCTTICPYGRLQGVLLDKNSLVVAYDYQRGEERGKIRKNEDRKLALKGDCIDCFQCVQVCPTGIDIRNGTQLECTNCTACIDACNMMMDAVGLERGLIRYASEESIKKREKFRFTPRVWLFSAILLLFVSAFFYLLYARDSVSFKLIRASSVAVHATADGRVGNTFNYTIYNNTNRTRPLRFQLESHTGTVSLAGNNTPTLTAGGNLSGALVVAIDKTQVKERKTAISIGVYDTLTGEKLDVHQTFFLSE